MLTRKMQSLCQGRGQRSHKTKNRRNFRGKIGEAISNLVAGLVSDLWPAKMSQLFSKIGRHLECAIQTELVVELELALIERKQYH